MKRCTCLLLSCLMALLFPASLAAEHVVTLKSGLTLIGDVSFENDDLVVALGEATLNTPLDNVAAVVPLGAGAESSAKSQLLTALEARLLNNAQGEVVGLLAEASRQHPDDSQIAFWYATSLVDAGFGEAAHGILEPRREAVANAYPGATDRLAARIKNRMELEALPPALLKRIDEINAEAPLAFSNPERRRLAAVFRIVDQRQRPIDSDALNVQAYGDDEQLEPFPQGLYLLTFTSHRNTSRQPSRIEVNQPGLKPTTFNFSPTSGRIGLPQEYVVHRYDDSDKVALRIQVVDPHGEPIPGARVALAVTTGRNNDPDDAQSATADDQGRVKLAAFPMRYSLRVQADDFKAATESVELQASSRPEQERRVTLYRAISATLRVAWTLTPYQNGDATSGETIIALGSRTPPPYGDPMGLGQTIRPMQVKDQLMIQFALHAYGIPPSRMSGSPVWLRALEVEDGGDARKDVESEFDQIDLKQIDQLKERSKEVSLGNGSGHPAQGVVAVEPGTIYVGQVPHRDMRAGQFAELTFKMLVEQAEPANDEQAAPAE